jgi:hypothetical protein
MALDGTYAGLQASIAAWINRTDLTAVIPDFITLAEAKIGRDLRLRKQIVSSTLLTVASTRGVNLPSDWLQFENVSIDGNPERQLNYCTVEQLDYQYPNGDPAGKPSLFTIEGDQILFGPMPDTVYTVNIFYYQKFTALSAGANWLFTNHPNIYLNLAMSYACHFIKDAKRTAEYLDLYERDKDALQLQDDTAQHSGSSLRVRTT